MAGNDSEKADYNDLPIEGLISAPLTASAKANASMAMEQTNFILSYGFEKLKGAESKNENDYRPVMVHMEYTRSFGSTELESTDDPEGQVITTTIQVPLLTLIPINNLAIEKVKVDFDLDITSQREDDMTDEDSPFSTSSRSSKKIHLFGQVGKRRQPSTSEEPKKGQKTSTLDKTATSLSVEITAGPLPLPLGLTSIISAYSKAITPVDKNKHKS